MTVYKIAVMRSYSCTSAMFSEKRIVATFISPKNAIGTSEPKIRLANVFFFLLTPLNSQKRNSHGNIIIK